MENDRIGRENEHKEKEKWDEEKAKSERAIEELWKVYRETEEQIKETHRKLERLGIVQGEVAEDLYRRSVKKFLEWENITVNGIITNM